MAQAPESLHARTDATIALCDAVQKIIGDDPEPALKKALQDLAANAIENASHNDFLRRVALRPTFGPFGEGDNGVVETSVHDKGGIAAWLFGAMAGMLEGLGGGVVAKNYVQISGYHSVSGRLELIMQRVGLLTPHEARCQAEAALGRAVALLKQHGIEWDGPTGPFLPDPPPPAERLPGIANDAMWCRLDISTVPNALWCQRCGQRQDIPDWHTADVYEALVDAFRNVHRECREGDAAALDAITDR